MQTTRLLPLALAAGVAGFGAAALPGGNDAAASSRPNFKPSTWDVVFGFEPIGQQSDPQTVVVTNVGDAPETFSSVEVIGSNPKDFAITSDDCGHHTLAPNGQCSVSAVFHPQASGTRVAALKFIDNTPCADFVHLVGSGTSSTRSAGAHAASCDGPDDTTTETTTVTNTVTTRTTKTVTTAGPTRTVTTKAPPEKTNSADSAKAIVLPARPCKSRRVFRIHLNPPAGKRFASVAVTINGRSLRVVRGKRLSSKIDLRGLPRGRFTLRVRATLLPSGTYVRVRHYVTCVPKG